MNNKETAIESKPTRSQNEEKVNQKDRSKCEERSERVDYIRVSPRKKCKNGT